MKSYDYAHRRGVRQLTWKNFVSLTDRMAELLEPYQSQVILVIARAGLFPATLLACRLRLELFPIRLTRRLNDQVIRQQPEWKTPVPPEVNGKVVVIVDEIADTGQTLAMAAEAACVLRASKVITASLVSHTWANPAPQVCSLITDEFVIFPWDQRVLQNGKWVPHPEVVAGQQAQGRSASS